MDPFHFACPHCSSRLRVREKLYVGREVVCPDCGNWLLIVEEGGELAARPLAGKGPALENSASPDQSATSDRAPRRAGLATPGPAGSLSDRIRHAWSGRRRSLLIICGAL